MPDLPTSFAVKARYVFPGDGAVVSDGVITVQADTIVGVGVDAKAAELIDLGNVAILPGLVNAHTHLELSYCSQPIGHSGIGFPDWIWEIVQRRRNESVDQQESARRRGDAILAGLAESRRYGVAVVGDITSSPWSGDLAALDLIHSRVFLELLGISKDRVEPQIDMARSYLEQNKTPLADWSAALSPHAPYTVHPDLLSRAVNLSCDANVPVAMHLAESLDEIELLMSGGGHFQQTLVDLDAWDPSAIPRGIRPLDYLKTLDAAPLALAIHGNFLDREEIQFVAQRADHMSVVYCPRTHRYFDHGRYPLREMLQAGVNVALGTDSRASNPDLSLLSEMRYIAEHEPAIALPSILRMGTAAGAKALGLDDKFGTIAPGKLARLTCVDLPDDNAEDPHRLVLHCDATAMLLADRLGDLL